MGARVGEPAPDFELAGTGGRSYRLSEYRGRPVVLVFYPGDGTPVCTVQLSSYTADIGAFAQLGAQILAISPDSVESHERFAERQGGFAFPLLADEGKEVAEAYGILGPLGFPRRSVFVIDPSGVVRYAHRALAGLTYRPTSELVRAVEAASAGTSVEPAADDDDPGGAPAPTGEAAPGGAGEAAPAG